MTFAALFPDMTLKDNETWVLPKTTPLPRCKNCKFWGTENIQSSLMVCKNHNMSGFQISRLVISVQAGDGLEGLDLAFPANFGCVYFEVKDGD